MNISQLFRHPAALIFLSLLATPAARALIMVGTGNEPVHDAGWPEGALAVANLKSRVGWWEGPPFGGGEWHFLYRGDTAAFTEALKTFASIRAPLLEVVVHDEPAESPFLKDASKPEPDTHYDWDFTVWVAGNWHRLYNNPKSVFAADQPQFRQPVDPPRLEVFAKEGGVDFSKITVPANVHVKDLRASAFGVNPIGGAMIRGDVFDIMTSKPISGARIVVERRTDKGELEALAEAATDNAGRAELVKIPAGNVRISVHAQGYAPRFAGYETLSERSFRALNVSLAKAATLRGTASDSEGKPLAGVEVRASSIALDGRGYPPPDAPNPKPVLSDDAGHFTFENLAAGFATLSANKPEYHFADLFTLHEVPGEVRIELARAGAVHIVVTDKAGMPLARFEDGAVLVEIEPKGGGGVGTWGGSAQVGADGTYDFVGVPAGEYRIKSRPNPASGNRDYAPDQLVKVEPGKSVSSP